MKNRQRRYSLLVAIAAGGAMVGISCGPQQDANVAKGAKGAKGEMVITYDPARPECPHDPNDPNGRRPLPQVTKFTTVADVPEYHDCQRFLVPDNDKKLHYHELEGIFVINLDAAYGLDTRTRKSATSSKALPLQNGLAVAIIYSEQDYDPLGIKEGYDCLVLQKTGTDTKTGKASYSAWMIALGPTDECSKQRQPSPSQSTSTPLDVNVIPPLVVNGVPDTVPPVARWDWDVQEQAHYIGLKCETNWCEVHWQAKPFTSSAAYTTNATSQVFRVKGWYDEQRLALPVNSNNVLFPDDAVGTVFPTPRPKALQMTDYPSGTWNSVAWVSLDKPSTFYQAKYGYEAAPPEAAATANGLHNDVAFCIQSSVPTQPNPPTCLPTGVTVAATCPIDTVNKGTWYARITSASGASVKYFCVKYRPLTTSSPPPGVVRWRWKLKDETIWVSCPNGCCEVDPDNN